MIKKVVAIMLALLTLLLSSCATTPAEETLSQMESTGEESTQPDTETIDEDTGSTRQLDIAPTQPNKDTALPKIEPTGSSSMPFSVPSYPLYFPMPYYYAFKGTRAYESAHNIDAFLHDSTVNYVCVRMGANEGGLILISLRLLDEWDAGDGARYYLCRLMEYDYYDLAEQLINGSDLNDYIAKGTGTGINSSGGLIRFKVSPYVENPNVVSFWGFSAVEILEQPMYGTEGGTVEELCDGRPIAEALLEAEQRIISDSDVPFVRDILPVEYTGDMFEYLNKYIGVFFPEFL